MKERKKEGKKERKTYRNRESKKRKEERKDCNLTSRYSRSTRCSAMHFIVVSVNSGMFAKRIKILVIYFIKLQISKFISNPL